jgi:hypothetical protein
VLAHLGGAKGAVQAHRERPGMGHRDPEGLRRLAGQGAARAVGDGARDHHRRHVEPFVAQAFDRIDRGLGVQRVEDRLDQDQVDAALDQGARRLAIGFRQAVEGDLAEARIVDVGRDAGGLVGRPDGAGHPHRPAGRVRRLARQPGGFAVQLRHQASSP